MHKLQGAILITNIYKETSYVTHFAGDVGLVQHQHELTNFVLAWRETKCYQCCEAKKEQIG